MTPKSSNWKFWANTFDWLDATVIIANKMINDFLIIHCIGIDDKLGLRINKDFFVEKLKNEKKK